MQKIVCVCVLFLACAISPLVFSENAQPSEEGIKLSLPQFIKKAISQNAELKMKDEDTHFAESRLKEVKANLLPTIEMTGILAPIYKNVGNALSSTEDKGTWGPLFKGGGQIIQPLYGFGKFGYYKEAATKGITAEKKQKDMKTSEVVFDVKQYYYSGQMASEMLVQLKESEEKVEKVIKRVDELLKMESGEVKQEDGYKLKVLLQELKKNIELAKKGEKLALAALTYKSGFSPDAKVQLDRRNLVKEDFKLQPIEFYQKLSLEKRPEMLALNSGLEARRALIDAEKTNRLPVFFLGGLLDAADTPSHIRNRQDSPYAHDPYNRITGGIGFGFKWNLDFWKVNAKVDGLTAEYLKLKHQKEVAQNGIPIEVKKAYLEFEEAFNNIEHAEKQRSYAKKWFLQSVFAWSFGVGDSREVLESVIFKGFSDKNYYDGLLNHNLAIASLSKATGTELLEHLKY